MSLWSRECPVCADIGWCNDHPIKDHDDMTTKPNGPEGLQERIARELCRQAGYDPDGAARNGWGWRNYMDGAAQIVAIFPANPVADAGGVTEADRELHMWLTGYPLDDGDSETVRRVVSHRLQSVAAATAAKDAEIARLREALLTINTIAAVQIGGSAQGNEAALKMIHDKTEAALSEAREAGAKD